MPDVASANPIGAALEGAAGVGELITGLINSGKSKREAAELEKTRPKYNISPSAKSEVSLAESELGNGLGAEATRGYETGLDKDFSNSLSTILKGGGSVNDVGSLYGNNQDARGKLAMMKENVRLNQISNLTSAWKNYTDQTDKQFQYNVDAPWKDKAQAVAEARKGSQGQIWNGINTAGSAAMNYSEEKNGANQYGNYLNPKSTASQGGGSPTLQYNDPTFNVAQDNPTSFSGNTGNNLLWSNTDIQGNGSQVTPRPMNTNVPNNNPPMPDWSDWRKF